MAARKASKPTTKTTSEADLSAGLDEVLALVPNAWAHHKDSTAAIYNGLSMIRATTSGVIGST